MTSDACTAPLPRDPASRAGLPSVGRIAEPVMEPMIPGSGLKVQSSFESRNHGV